LPKTQQPNLKNLAPSWQIQSSKPASTYIYH
jgi:hypothetical protein